MMNTSSIALAFISLHMVGDFLFQNQWMADNKFIKWKSRRVYRGIGPFMTDSMELVSENFKLAMLARTVHVSLYTISFVVLAFFTLPIRSVPWVAVAIFIPHWLIDSKRWFANHPWPAKSLMVDQTLHSIHLVIVFAFFYGQSA